jgi:hypothetical protein
MLLKPLPFLLLMIALLGGCMSASETTSEADQSVKCSISQNSTGLVTISWPSEVGYNYRMVAFCKTKTQIGDRVYRGTGDTITVQFRLDPSLPLPEYRVDAWK